MAYLLKHRQWNKNSQVNYSFCHDSTKNALRMYLTHHSWDFAQPVGLGGNKAT